jgi:hypothetical protein
VPSFIPGTFTSLYSETVSIVGIDSDGDAAEYTFPVHVRGINTSIELYPGHSDKVIENSAECYGSDQLLTWCVAVAHALAMENIFHGFGEFATDESIGDSPSGTFDISSTETGAA